MRKRLLWAAGALALSMLAPLAAGGQTCQPVKQGEELRNPPEIPKQRGVNNYVVKTTLDVQEKPFCIPTKDNGDGTWTTTPLTLRTYVYPNPQTGTPTWGIPGPTLRLRKAEGSSRSDSLEILLKNSLPFPTSHGCNNACPADVTSCDCSSGALEALIPRCTAGNNYPKECCCVYNCTQQMPNCQHDDNVTNLHFHGSHVSPQEPQDFVLLDLYPPRPVGDAAAMDHMAATHGDLGRIVYGEYQYKIPEFGPTQPEGTHWYHPHKHGSTSLQVTNGLAGALLIEGSFDDFLKPFYTSEKLLVVQAISDTSRLGAPAGQVLVNGMIKPKITGRPGEIQRWRIINATMNSRTLLRLTLPDPDKYTYRQIALDGVRFSQINYGCQPLLNFDASSPVFPCNPNPGGKPQILLAPGNRADFLIQFPLAETKGKGVEIQGVMLDLQAETPSDGQPMLKAAGDVEDVEEAPETSLFSVFVDDGITGNDDKPKKLAKGAPTGLPVSLPPMPSYLRNITDSEVQGNDINMTFQQFLANSSTQQWPYSGAPLSTFKIDGKQFDDQCANVTTTLDKAAQWTVNNATLLRHPFHIHTNAFQVTSVKGVPVQPQGQPRPEPFWADTLMLPTATVDPKFPPDLTKPYDIKIRQASFTLRQRYELFTGAYVLHCHILGHEDRGMMLSVQTVCPAGTRGAGKFGRPTTDPNGECVAGAPFFGPLPACK